jgi:hypothetical protein
MPSTRLNTTVVLTMAGLLLPLMFIPFSTMATPTVSQESKASPAPSNPDPSMTHNSTAVDIAFGLREWPYSFPIPCDIYAHRRCIVSFLHPIHGFRLDWGMVVFPSTQCGC